MSTPIIKGIVRRKAAPRKVVNIKTLKTEELLKKTSSLNKELESLKQDVIETVDLGLEQVIQTVDQKMEEVDSVLDSVVEKTNEIIEVMSELEAPQGIPGDDGEDGKDADEEKIKEEVLAELRKTLDREAIIQELLLRIPPAQVIDEKALLKKLLSKVPESKESLKIIRENIEVDPMAIIQKIMELPAGKFKIKSDQVDGLEQTMSAFRSQLGKGYLHGGGDTVVAGTNITITTDSQGRKVISSTGGGGGGTPSNTVVSETTYGQASTAGVSTDYSRGDHSHGTPALPTKGDIGLGNVDNTSDLNKPISTATQTALDLKVDDTELVNYFNKTTDDTDDITEGATNKFNQTHTGEVTGATVLTLDKTTITNKTAVVPVGADYLIFSDTSDSGNLKKALISTLPGGGGGGTVNSVVAGDNVVVDSTDPANPIVSAYGANTDGGTASSVYLPVQVINGGGA